MIFPIDLPALFGAVVASIHIGAVEAIWIVLNLTTLILAVVAYHETRRDAANVRSLNGHAREIAADGNVRRELIRVGVQSLLLGVTIPGIFNDREVMLTLPVLFLMILPVLLLTSSFLDARDRKNMMIVIAADLLHDREFAYARLEAAAERIMGAIETNTAITQRASDRADHVTSETEDAIATVEDTHSKVVDLHDKMVDGGAPTS